MDTLVRLYNKLKNHLNLTPDREDENIVIDNIRQAADFRGVTLWILIFAVIIASIGLNIDSTNIVTGAMLISPLMTPIIGVGLAVGINDMELMKRSMRNLLIAALFAILAATIYFWLSPLNEARSQLLSRTSPTFYDVLTALTGGAAGFLALSTKGKHIQVIIGAALSTALLPPLCTVGYGIATSNWLYAIGALYLFFINSVFIAISAFTGVRFFKFSPKYFADKQRERKVRRMIIAVSLITLLPSVLLTYNIVRKTIYIENAQLFIAKELDFPNTQIIEKQIDYSSRSIEAVIVGNYLPGALIEDARLKLPEYNLKGTHLKILQDGDGRDSLLLSSISNNFVKELYTQNRWLEKENTALRDSLGILHRYARLDSAIYEEAHILFPSIERLTIGIQWSSSKEKKSPTGQPFVNISTRGFMNNDERLRLSNWLRHRMSDSSLSLEFSTASKNGAKNSVQ